MANADLIDQYLKEIARLLPDNSRRATRFWFEVESHLRDAAEEWQRRGLEPSAAAAVAVDRFGTPDRIVKRFVHEAPFTSENEAMIRYCLISLSVVTIAFGVLFFVATWFDDAPPPLTIAKAALAAIITLYSLVLLKQVWSTGPKSAWVQWFEFGGGLVLIAIGAAGAVWTAHLGQVTGDWEYYGFVGAGLLALQGAFAACSVAMSRHADRRLCC